MMHNVSQEDGNERFWNFFKGGDSNALGDLVKIHYRTLYKYGKKFTKQDTLIEDCIQDLFLQLWERRSFISETKFVKYYLLKSLRSIIVKKLMKYSHDTPFKGVFDATNYCEDDFETTLIAAEILQNSLTKLKLVLGTLSKRQQEAIYLKYYENLSHEQIADIMSISVQGVSTTVYRAVKQMREMLSQFQTFMPYLVIFFPF